MAKGFKEASARSKPVYGTLIGSAQPTEQTPDVQEVHRVCCATLKRMKHKQKGVKCGIIGAREMVKTARKVCRYVGGANV